MIPVSRFVKLSTLATFALALLITGCGQALVGSWETTEKSEVKDFAIRNATFKDDGTYVASALKGEETVRLAGTYEFDGFNLKLKDPGKPERKYSATVVMGNTLKLKSGESKITMKKK